MVSANAIWHTVLVCCFQKQREYRFASIVIRGAQARDKTRVSIYKSVDYYAVAYQACE